MKGAKYLALAILLLLIILLLVFTHTKQCDKDENCFNWQARECSRATVLANSKDNLFQYTIEGKNKDLCVVKVELMQLSPGAPENVRQAVEGKGMLCGVPQIELQQKPISQIDDINQYCTGPLKEVLLELSLERLQEIVVKNIGPITTQFKSALEGINGTG